MMFNNNNDQFAKRNSNSQIIQVRGDLNIDGISEERARLICREECAKALEEWSFEAGAIVEKRVQKLEDKVLPKMIAQDESLKIFGDPSFQLLIRKAQIAAACSEREDDYEMLSELLLHRCEQNNNRERRLGITKAVEIIDQIEDTALVALSVAYAIERIAPVSENPVIGLSALEDIYSKLIAGKELPSGTSWMEHMDLLAAIRLGVNGIGSFKKLTEYIPDVLPRYFYIGMPSEDEKLLDLKRRFERDGLPLSCFHKNYLKSGYEVFAIYNIEECYLIRLGQKIELSHEQKELVHEAQFLMQIDGRNDQELSDGFWRLWNSHPTLKILKEWWDQLPVVFSFTPVGVALSNAYIHGKDPSLPCVY